MTSNHDYNTPQQGSTDWHVPLNENFEALDDDVEVRDVEANRGSYDPKAGAKFYATDTGRTYLGDGATWARVDSTGPSPALERIDRIGTFLGIGRSTPIAPAESFGLDVPALSNRYGGMYLNTPDTDGRPFYGYSVDGSAAAWHFYDGREAAWTLTVNRTTDLTVDEDGNVVFGEPGNQVRDGSIGATIGGGGFTVDGHDESNVVADHHATIAGGHNNSAGDPDTGLDTTAAATVGGGGYNVAFGSHATVAGGRSNIAEESEVTIGGGRGNVIRAPQATIGGGVGNGVPAGGNQATIGGGGSNEASAKYATVPGGDGNTASGEVATVGGGQRNVASGRLAAVGGGSENEVTAERATVGGGDDNEATAGGSTIGGGVSNRATGLHSTVGGGNINRAVGHKATVPGGFDNYAGGNLSFAAGTGAAAAADGAFVWGDSSNQQVRSTIENEFKIQAGGGAVFYSKSDLSSGVSLATGSGSWSTSSSRTVKEHVDPIDPGEVLEGVRGLDVSTWQYSAQDDGTVHMGPMAEDFHDAFGLGEDDESISSVDADGVAFAAIQGVATEVDDHVLAIEALREENATLRRRADTLEDRIETLEAQVGEA